MQIPKKHLHAKDRALARLQHIPCKDSDLGNGCYEAFGCKVRQSPCALYDTDALIRSVPIDQCYKMEKMRRYRGVWTGGFESSFLALEGTKLELSLSDLAKLPVADQKKAAIDRHENRIWLDTSRVRLGTGARSAKIFVDFYGRKTKYPGMFGHLGMAGHVIIPDRLILSQEIE